MIKHSILISFNLVSLAVTAQDNSVGLKTFYLTDGEKVKPISQSDYFTVYLLNQTPGRKNEVFEGYLLEAKDTTYYFDIFFEEYEAIDSDSNVLVKHRCDLTKACDRYMSFSQHNIEFIEHNTNTKITLGKLSFLFSVGALFATTYMALNPKVFERPEGGVNMNKKWAFVGGGLGLTTAGVVIGIKLINPRKYHFNYRRPNQKVWYIEE